MIPKTRLRKLAKHGKASLKEQREMAALLLKPVPAPKVAKTETVFLLERRIIPTFRTNVTRVRFSYRRARAVVDRGSLSLSPERCYEVTCDPMDPIGMMHGEGDAGSALGKEMFRNA